MVEFFWLVISLLPDYLKPFTFHWNLKAVFNYRASHEVRDNDVRRELQAAFSQNNFYLGGQEHCTLEEQELVHCIFTRVEGK